MQIKTVGVGTEEIKYYLTVEILASGIQSQPKDAFEETWTSSGLEVKTTDENNVELEPNQWKLIKKVSG